MSKLDGAEIFKRRILPIIIILSLGITCFFSPFIVYRIAVRFEKPTLGVHYDYIWESESSIINSLAEISYTGFKIIRTYLWCVPDNPLAFENNRTVAFYSACNQYSIKTAVIVLHESISQVEYYATTYGENIAYFQILNEPELMQGWAPGALYLQEELDTLFNSYKNKLDAIKTSRGFTYTYYTNFSPAYILRPDVAILLSKKLDFVGLDIYKEAGLVSAHYFYKYLGKLTGKEIIITEFGVAEDDDYKQTDFIMNGLETFRGMKVSQVWLCYWSGGSDKGYTLGSRPVVSVIRAWLNESS